MIEALKEHILKTISAAIATRFGQVELPPLTLGYPPDLSLGDLTFGVFPLAKPLRMAPPVIARELMAHLSSPLLKQVRADGPYLNLTIAPEALFGTLLEQILLAKEPYGNADTHKGETAMVEFSSPNTNKPLHIGHIRNIVLGDSVSQLLEAVGYHVVRACLVNDRGVHISKSMLAYTRFFEGETPTSRKQKGDHFVGDCYVAYAKAEKAEQDTLKARFEAEGLTGDALKKQVDASSELNQAIRAMLRQWEAGDEGVRRLWETMNGWVYQGFNQTYSDLGVKFDKFYYESELYTSGRAIVLDALERGLVEQRADGSIWVDLTADGMDPKVLLRSDGTSLYITQDIGTALQKFQDYGLSRSIYVIGNEQDHQMKALFATLRRLGYAWADGLFHLSYGMVNLPAGRMKSREGTVVDADDLMTEVFEASYTKAREAKMQDIRRDGEGGEEEELTRRSRQVGLGAIKFFMLKINPRKDFVFNPEESIQLQGDTGPYIQYTHARTCSILRKAADQGVRVPAEAAEIQHFSAQLGNLEERSVARLLVDFPRLVAEAAERLQPSTLCSYLVELAAAFNKFYHDHSVLSADSTDTVQARLLLTRATGTVLARGLALLGIEAPEAM